MIRRIDAPRHPHTVAVLCNIDNDIDLDVVIRASRGSRRVVERPRGRAARVAQIIAVDFRVVAAI